MKRRTMTSPGGLLRAVLSMVIAAGALAGCTNVLQQSSPSSTTTPTVKVAVSLGGPTIRSLDTDQNVASVVLDVWANFFVSGSTAPQLMGTTSLTKSGGSYHGSVTLSQTGQIAFVVYAYDATGTLLYVGKTLKTIGSAANTSLTVPVAVATAQRGTVTGTVPAINGYLNAIIGASSNTAFSDGTFQAAHLDYPSDVATDGKYLYITDLKHYRIRRELIADGTVDTLAGDGTKAHRDGVGTNSSGTKAEFQTLAGLTVMGSYLYVADGSYIRKVNKSTGQTTTLTLSSSAGPFNGITNDGTYLYVTEGFGANTTRGILKIDPSTSPAPVTTLVSTSNWSTLNQPYGITTIGNGLLFVVDGGVNKILKVDSSASTVSISVYAGSGDGRETDATGTSASFNYPRGITTDGTNLYVTDFYGETVRKINIATQVVTTIAGTANKSGTQWGTMGNGRLYDPQGLTTDGAELYVASSDSNLIVKVQ